MNQLYRAQSVLELGTALFTASGVRTEDARAVVESLVTSSLMGHDSHGVIRIPEYLRLVQEGSVALNASIVVERTGPATAVVDCGRGFGAVGAERAMREGIALAREQKTASVITRQCHHVGRLGAWVQLAAAEGLIGLAVCSSPIHGHYVLPWGGREGRLATNPIAYAVPTSGDPLLADFSTSVAPEGKIRFYRNAGKPVPEGWILDASGSPTTDPNAFYGPPRGGLLPLGGGAGHKGFALSLLVEILANVMPGNSTPDPRGFGNGVCFIVIDPAAFVPLDQFRTLMDETIAYMKSSPPVPGCDEVLVPGELEFRTLRRRQTEGVPVDDVTLREMQEQGKRLGVDIEGLLHGENP